YTGRGDEDARRRRTRLLHGVGHGGVDGDAVHVGARLPRVRACDHMGAVVAVAQPVEAPLRPSETLIDDLGLSIDEDAHEEDPASSTTRRAASIIVGREIRRSDSYSFRIARPSSALVPSRRMTMGDLMSTRFSASTIPLAT